MKYPDQLVDWLVDEGYTHCFYVAGGNIMHILNSVRTRTTCVPFVHEVAAGIAAEYFTEASDRDKAFVLVTAGLGLTSIIIAMAGAFLEGRELLVIGGQVKSSDLALGEVRQRGIQEIDGMALAAPVTVSTLQVRQPVPRAEFIDVVRHGSSGRHGAVFIELCLDAQGAAALEDQARPPTIAPADWSVGVDVVVGLLARASRPILLIGGGLDRDELECGRPGLEYGPAVLRTAEHLGHAVGKRSAPACGPRRRGWHPAGAAADGIQLVVVRAVRRRRAGRYRSDRTGEGPPHRQHRHRGVRRRVHGDAPVRGDGE